MKPIGASRAEIPVHQLLLKARDDMLLDCGSLCVHMRQLVGIGNTVLSCTNSVHNLSEIGYRNSA